MRLQCSAIFTFIRGNDVPTERNNVIFLSIYGFILIISILMLMLASFALWLLILQVFSLLLQCNYCQRLRKSQNSDFHSTKKKDQIMFGPHFFRVIHKTRKKTDEICITALLSFYNLINMACEMRRSTFLVRCKLIADRKVCMRADVSVCAILILRDFTTYFRWNKCECWWWFLQ